jgi:hypothetical protein
VVLSAVAIDASVPVGTCELTVTDAVPLWLSDTAVIVAVPAETAVTRPVVFTGAIAALELFQPTDAPVISFP